MHLRDICQASHPVIRRTPSCSLGLRPFGADFAGGERSRAPLRRSKNHRGSPLPFYSASCAANFHIFKSTKIVFFIGVIFRFFAATLSSLLLSQCAFDQDGAIPPPSGSVSRIDAIKIAYTYSQITWKADERNVRHGKDPNGILVHTPDTELSKHGFSNGWWEPNTMAKGMPYQWGGFDTPREFLASIERGEYAGDISTAEKRRLGDDGTSKQACGIDCSGFVSRCWRLSRPYSTQQLHEICDRLESWDDLKPGDILLNDRHVVLFAKNADSRSSVLVYEAGPFPYWRVNAAEIRTAYLKDRGYHPWRYRNIRD